MIHLDTLQDDDIWQMREWRNALKRVCREYRDISDDHQVDWWESYRIQAREPNPETLLWGIYNEDNELIGVGGWTYINWHTRRAELTYYLAPEMAGKGYGKAALKLLLDKAFHDLALHSVYGEVHEFNEASVKCMLKCGFRQIGTYADAAIDTDTGKYVDVILLEMVNALR